MRRKDLQDTKIKRILFFYTELERYRVSHDESVKFICYVFSVTDRWIEEILRLNDLKAFSEVKLLHLDIDIQTIDAFVKKLSREAKKERQNQMLLF